LKLVYQSIVMTNKPKIQKNQMNKEIAKTGLNFLGIVFATCTLHWALVNTYVMLCAPFSMWGAFSAFVSLGSPLCQFLNYVQFELAKHYITIWGAAGVALVVWLVAKFKAN